MADEPSAMPVAINQIASEQSPPVSQLFASASGQPSLHASLPAGFLHQASPEKALSPKVLADVDVPTRLAVNELADVDVPGLRMSMLSDVDVRRSYGSLPPNVTESTLRDSMVSVPATIGSQPVMNQPVSASMSSQNAPMDSEISPRPLPISPLGRDLAPYVIDQATAAGPNSGVAPLLFGHQPAQIQPAAPPSYAQPEMAPFSGPTSLAPPPIRLPGLGASMPAPSQSLYTTQSVSYMSRSGKEQAGSFTVMPSNINDQSRANDQALQLQILQEENSMLRQNLQIEQQAHREYVDRKELETENLNRRLRKVEDKNAQEDLEISKMSLELEERSSSLRACEQNLENQRQLVFTLKQQLDVADERGRKADVSLIEKEVKLNQEIEQLRSELANNDNELRAQLRADFDHQNQLLQMRLREERENARGMMSDIRTLKEQINSLEEEKARLQQDLASSKSEKKALLSELEAANEVINSHSAGASDLEKLRKESNEKLEKALATMSDLQKQHAEMRQMNSGLNAENNELKKSIASMQALSQSTLPSTPPVQPSQKAVETSRPLLQPQPDSTGLQSIGLGMSSQATEPPPLSNDSETSIPKVLSAKATAPEFVSPRYNTSSLVMQQLRASNPLDPSAANTRGPITAGSLLGGDQITGQEARIARQSGPDPSSVSDALNQEISMGNEDDQSYGGQSVKPRQGISLKNFQSFPVSFNQPGALGSSAQSAAQAPPLRSEGPFVGSFAADEGTEAPFSSAQSFATFERTAEEMRLAGYDPDSVIGV